MTEIPALIAAFTTLFVIIDPPGLAPLFVALTQGMTPAQRRSILIRAVLISFGLMIAFLLLGEALLGREELVTAREQLEQARALLEESWAELRRLGKRGEEADTLEALARAHLAAGEPTAARSRAARPETFSTA